MSANDFVFEDDRKTSRVDQAAGEREQIERWWDFEWQEHVVTMALEKIKAKVSPLQYQIFYHYAIKEWKPSEVCDSLNVTMAQVYVAKHRVGSIFKKELKALQEQDGE